MSKSPTVCILTSGKGTRMGPYASYMNKSLLPINQQAAISHIIAKFPPTSEFVISVGFLGDQVKDYLALAHPNCRFTFVEVDNFDKPGSGPGYSLICCYQWLQKPFYYISCDTLWEEDICQWEEASWVGIAHVEPGDTERYCNMRVVDGRVAEIRDKEHVEGQDFTAFVGIGFVKDFPRFWDGLRSTDLIAGEHQVSNGFRQLAASSLLFGKVVTWTDLGDLDKYRRAVSRYEQFDYSKPEEALYIVNGRVVKFFADASVVERRVKRHALNPGVFPPLANIRSHFYSYTFQPGQTLYQANNPQVFAQFLEWLEKRLWKPVSFSVPKMEAICRQFYYDKTRERLDRYYQKHDVKDSATWINDHRVPATGDLLAAIPWERVCQGVPTFFHGDLQFDNILYDERSSCFTLLDWRDSFAGELGFGDQYYDFAKLYGGIFVNYDYIKRGLFSVAEAEDRIWLDFAQRFLSGAYITCLEQAACRAGLERSRIKLIACLIYLNMAPLHHFPYDKFLYSLGRLLLAKELHLAEYANSC